MRPYRPEGNQGFTGQLQLGYYPVRAKAQLPRLLMEYLHIDYQDRFFTPDQWSRFRDGEAREWTIKDLPYLRDGHFVVTGVSGILTYILEKSRRAEMMGATLADKVRLDSLKSKHDIKSAIEGAMCAYQEDKGRLLQVWGTRIEPILRDYQNDCPAEGWYLGYISIMDFFVYELLNLIEVMFPEAITKFVRSIALRKRFGAIPEIKDYEASKRAVKEYSPVVYFSKFKEEKLKAMNQMDIE